MLTVVKWGEGTSKRRAALKTGPPEGTKRTKREGSRQRGWRTEKRDYEKLGGRTGRKPRTGRNLTNLKS